MSDMIKPAWQYDELKQVGVDYTDLNEVEAYDLQMGKLRNIEKEVSSIIKETELLPDHSVLEIGTGTGELAIGLAKNCEKVYAVDISPVMLDFAQSKAAARGIYNIEFNQGGFLTYQHQGQPLDLVVSQLALHHLPDFWKLIALKRINSILTKGGKFYLRDTVYSFQGNHDNFFGEWIKGIKEAAGDEMAKDVEMAVRDEYSTWDWIMEGLIQRADFLIEKAEYQDGFLATYICRKQ